MTELPRSPMSQLSKFAAAMRDPDPDGAWKLAETMWKEHGIAIFILPDVDRKRGWSAMASVRNIARNCYGNFTGVKK